MVTTKNDVKDLEVEVDWELENEAIFTATNPEDDLDEVEDLEKRRALILVQSTIQCMVTTSDTPLSSNITGSKPQTTVSIGTPLTRVPEGRKKATSSIR
ncbi:predicted protein [Sclerotinia sclerotiorum 1980 UF-70]|uniref:Uncharacterized protein n=2 Tax=Sclerotinia sclerotiorum (strain ATCC 18683 / 1980 / Ss-1) TaxID=665079 RepID=A7F7L7_SCLS1|nr:predicted protein [Sclerotinia sclerotiorum 1980 UF-70]APA15049.1 hypothetical protein sscle_14g098190 [Sclerotinia sclerotiorum 1980 UF-70]EDN98738.1 predicted protein [Sclerotinia sclerotiorum 1980 UF-70]